MANPPLLTGGVHEIRMPSLLLVADTAVGASGGPSIIILESPEREGPAAFVATILNWYAVLADRSCNVVAKALE